MFRDGIASLVESTAIIKGLKTIPQDFFYLCKRKLKAKNSGFNSKLV